MAVETRSVYGIQNATAIHRGTGLPYGIMQVIGGSNYSLTGELVSLNGGSYKFPVQVEESSIAGNVELTVREYPDWITEVFLGGRATVNAAEANAAVAQTLTNVKGTSAFSAGAGVASVGIKSGSETDVKYGRYVLEVTGANTVKVYGVTNVDFGRGTELDFLTNALDISGDLTVPDGAAVEVPGLGIELTGGTSVAMTVGDTAEFELRPQNSGSTVIKVGANTDIFPEIRLMTMAAKQGTGALFELDIFRVKGVGLPINMTEKAFSEASITAQSYYDSVKNGVFQIKTTKSIV